MDSIRKSMQWVPKINLEVGLGYLAMGGIEFKPKFVPTNGAESIELQLTQDSGVLFPVMLFLSGGILLPRGRLPG